MSEIKAGDVVCLKSGSPSMTVESVGSYNGKTKAECSWFEGFKRYQELFAIESIELDTEDEE